jgi:hypothetical protein
MEILMPGGFGSSFEAETAVLPATVPHSAIPAKSRRLSLVDRIDVFSWAALGADRPQYIEKRAGLTAGRLERDYFF